MNDLIFRIFTLLATVSLAACSPQAPRAEPPLAGTPIGGSFTLTDQNAKPFSDGQLSGQYRIMYFGYTYCPDVCPVDMQNIGAAMKMIEADDPELAAKITPVFITVDPERDGPKEVGEFVAAFHPRAIGLTGSPEAIAQTAKKFVVVYSKEQSEGATGYLVNHTRQAYLMGPGGEPIALLPTDESAKATAAEIRRWAI